MTLHTIFLLSTIQNFKNPITLSPLVFLILYIYMALNLDRET